MKLVLPDDCASYFYLKIAVANNFNCNKIEICRYTESLKPSFDQKNADFSEANAMSKLCGDDCLWGRNVKENAMIYQWIEFSDAELHPAVCLCTFPLLGLRKCSSKETTEASSYLSKCLSILDSHLFNHMYMLGDRITQADIACAAALIPAYQLVLGEEAQLCHCNVTRWFNTMINQPQFSGEMIGNTAQKWTNVNNDTKNSNGTGTERVKSAAQLKKEAKKLEKLERFKAKQQKLKEQSKSANNAATKPQSKPEKNCKIICYDRDTSPGEKKDITDTMPESYSPKYVEAAWYDWWAKLGLFKPEYNKEKTFRENAKGIFMVCLPPPNVTGTLHLGHALTNTIQDVLSRWHRMKGETVLWTPGTDHAGIATQVVVEKKLWKEKKLSRHDLGREAFVNEVWKWKQEKGNEIYHQLKVLGSSLDWDREFFTMNEHLSNAVKYSFIKLHDRGIIFRSNRLINWSCTLRSAISDIEVNKHELTGRTMLTVPGYIDKVEFGVLISFAYPIVGDKGEEELVVATTRIETMLGDTAVAVHPEDDRYKHLHGKFVHHPLCDRHIPVVCDEMVDREFGTGAVKITPAHDPNDYECGKRHNLPFITIFTDDGFVMNTNTVFDGMKRFNARTAVLQALKDKNLYRGVKDNPMVVPICSRSKDIVEPLIKVQWFMNCKEAAAQAVEEVKRGNLKITPDMHCKIWYHWLENIRDWCISRQLWWGHRIPAYFVTIDDESVARGEESDGQYWVSAMSELEARDKAAIRFGVSPSKVSLKQDEDVLDTWYSSGLLPFSIFGWPNETDDLKTFFPGTLLETGHDILFFWVARMVMFSILLTGKLPFKEVYLHAMVRDAHGRKMSKSLGNVIDPLDVVNGITLEELHQTLLRGNLDAREVERAMAGQKQDYPNGIPECGSDALRFALCAYTCQGRDINLDVLRILGYRHFCNKLWNAFKFACRGLGENFEPSSSQDTTSLSLVDQWILSKLTKAIRSSNTGLSTYEFPTYTTAVFNFWLYELCDVYLEHLKPVLAGSNQSAIATSRNVLYTCLEVALRLTHPLMPFITEELWQRLPHRPGEEHVSISVCDWPDHNQFKWDNDVIEREVDLSMSIVKAARVLRADYNLTKAKAPLYVRSAHASDDVIGRYCDLIKTLSCSFDVTVIEGGGSVPPGCAVAVVNDKYDVCLLLKGIVDVGKEVEKLTRRREELSRRIGTMREKMKRPEYKTKVPTKVQESDQEKIRQMESEMKKLAEAQQQFSKIAR